MSFVHQQYIDHYNDWLKDLNKNSETENNEEKEDLASTANPTSPTNLSPLESETQPIPSTSSKPSITPGSEKTFIKKIDYDEVKVFENDQLTLYVKKAFHQRQKRFRLQDSLFHIKVKVKNQVQKPLLRDLVKVLEEAFTFILNNIRTFFKVEDHNIAYLTLFQEPMVNGLNTGS
jgi:hypothetical protein